VHLLFAQNYDDRLVIIGSKKYEAKYWQTNNSYDFLIVVVVPYDTLAVMYYWKE
jgi:hypothetical protein